MRTPEEIYVEMVELLEGYGLHPTWFPEDPDERADLLTNLNCEAYFTLVALYDELMKAKNSIDITERD